MTNVLLTALLCALGVATTAQTESRVRGVVRESQGGIVRDAVVVITPQGTGPERTSARTRAARFRWRCRQAATLSASIELDSRR